MQKPIIKLLIYSIITFVIGVFFISINNSPQYDTKDLIGKKIKKIQLDHFSVKKKNYRK